MKSKRLIYGVLIFVVALLSLVGLDGDPPLLKQLDDIWDEGAWAENARCKVLFGSYLVPPNIFGFGLIGSPLFTLFLRIFFSIGGVNIFTGRLLSVVSFWLVLITIFVLFRKQGYSTLKSIVPVFILGTNHEALIHARWSTPIFVELLFHTLSIVLLILGVSETKSKSKKNLILFAAGLSFMTALAAKLTAIYMIFVFFGSLFIFVRPLKWLKIKQLYLVLAGTLVGGIALLGFYASNYKTTEVFIALLIVPNLVKELYRHDISKVFFNSGLVNPMAVLLLIGALLLLIYRMFQAVSLVFISKARISVKSFDPIEVASILWLMIGIISMVIFRDYYYRRYILFLVPLSFLYSKMTFIFIGRKERVSLSVKNRKQKLALTEFFTITLAIVGLAYTFLPTAQTYFNDFWVLSPTHSPVLIFAKSTFYGLLLLFTIVFTYLFGYRLIPVSLTLILTAINLGLGIQWISNTTYSFKNESRRLSQLVNVFSLWAGNPPYSLFYEARNLLPVIYIKDLPLNYYGKFDIHLREKVVAGTADLYIPEIQGVPHPREYLTTEDFSNLKKISLGDFHLFPIPGTSRYRYVLHITRITHEAVEKTSPAT